MSAGVWDLMPSRCRWIETLRHCGKTLLRRQRRLLRRLKKAYLHSWRSADELNMLVGAKVGGATPLVIACRNGHYDVAEYLIERCKADIEQPGSVTFDGETIEGAPPLWCAAAAGHLQLVKLLVRAGANVNSTTRTHSTPLRAACFDGHSDIVKFLVENGADIEIANRHGHTCLMIACYKGHIRIAKYLLSLNADVNRKSVKGNTALHDCAESGSLNILKMLLGHGATMDVDSYGMTPLLAASVTGHTHIVEHLINAEYGLVTRQQRIDALELLGATYVDKRRDMVGALALWKRAMDDRFPADGSEPIPKPKDIPRIEAYDYAVEPSNAQQLEEILADPDGMRMQALVIRERILGPAHPDTSYYVRYRGAVYADAGRFARCRQLWHHALDMQRAVLPPLSPLTQSSLYSFAELFSYMLAERARPPLRGRIVPPVTFEDIEPVFRKTLSEIDRGMELLDSKLSIDREQTLSTLQRVLVISLHLAALMARLLEEPDCTEEVSRKIHKAVYSLVKLDIKVRQGRGALHVACSAEGAREPYSHALSCLQIPFALAAALRRNLVLAGAGEHRVVALASCTSSAWSDCIIMLAPGVPPHALHAELYTERAWLAAPGEPAPAAAGLVQLMLRLGAPDARDADGNTPLHLVCKVRHTPSTLNYILERAWLAAPGEPAPAAAGLVQLMLRLGAPPDARDADGNTPLHLVCKLNPCPAEVVRELLSHGAHIDTVNYEGETPEEILKSTQQSLTAIVNPLRYTTLKCLAARTVKNYRLPYRHVIPQCLHSTVITH
uniref:Protein fem-1 homolog CG6966 n=1 Tax=Heliothis virescens TaxID=7102 RepID=A0A2A4K246_HELVI